MVLTDFLSSIANKIRECNQYAPEKIKATDFPQEIEYVSNESEMRGYNWGQYEGIQQGKQEQYDMFWDKFQDYGNRPHYTNAFWSWYDGAYNPKYPIICQKNWSTVDMFRNAYITDTIVDIELKGNNNASRMFYDSATIVTVRKIKLDETNNISDSFRNCKELQNITIDGAIGCTISFLQSTKLTVESLRSILTALSKNSTYANGKTATFSTASRTLIENDSICSAQLASAVGAGWTVAYA